MTDRNKFRTEGCCSAKTGANLIGMLYGVTAFYLFIATVDYFGEVFSLSGDEDAKRFLNMMGLSGVAKYNIVGVKCLRVVTIGLALIHGISYLTSAMLIIGINTGNEKLLLPWIIYFILLLVAYLIVILIGAALIIALHGMIAFATIVPPAIILLLLWSFFILAINRHYTELTETPPPGDVVRKNSEDKSIPSVSFVMTRRAVNPVTDPSPK